MHCLVHFISNLTLKAGLRFVIAFKRTKVNLSLNPDLIASSQKLAMVIILSIIFYYIQMTRYDNATVIAIFKQNY